MEKEHKSHKLAWLGWLIPLAVVIVVVALVLIFYGRNGNGAQSNGLVKIDHDYLVTVALVEISETQADGSKWDIDDSAPDVQVKIKWRNEWIFTSTQKPNSLLAVWPEDEIRIIDSIKTGVVEGQRAGAKIRIRPADYIDIFVYDKDLFSRNDLAGKLHIATDKLKVGPNTFKLKNQPLKRVQLKVYPIE